MAITALRNARLIDGVVDHVRVSTIAFDTAGIIAIGRGAEDVIRTAESVTVHDVEGRLVAPALIDLHGDAFERSLMPRGGVFASAALALQDNRAQLAASGIATSFLSATDSWEPGLRSRETLRMLVQELSRSDPHGPEVRLHVRRETTVTEGFGELRDWISAGAVAMVSFADHTPGGIADVAAEPSATQLARSGLNESDMRTLVDKATTRRRAGVELDVELARVCHQHGCPTASHDGNSLADVARDRALGVTIAEFPTSVEVAQAYRNLDMTVLFGAPNLVRGGSHLGNLSVADALIASRGDVLCSDYHYPSLLQAPFAAEQAGLCSLATAWKAVSASAADAACMSDRGRLVAGQRGDIVVVDDRSEVPRAVQLFVNGTSVYQVACAPTN